MSSPAIWLSYKLMHGRFSHCCSFLAQHTITLNHKIPVGRLGDQHTGHTRHTISKCSCSTANREESGPSRGPLHQACFRFECSTRAHIAGSNAKQQRDFATAAKRASPGGCEVGRWTMLHTTQQHCNKRRNLHSFTLHVCSRTTCKLRGRQKQCNSSW